MLEIYKSKFNFFSKGSVLIAGAGPGNEKKN